MSATAPGIRCTPDYSPLPTRPATWTGRSASTPRSTVPTSTRPPSRVTQGDLWNHKNLHLEPADHAIGRSRGGLSTKIHHACDGKGRPLVMLLGPGQGGDFADVRPCPGRDPTSHGHGPGRPRTRPDRVMADKAYSSRGSTGTCCASAASSRSSPSPPDQALATANDAGPQGRPTGRLRPRCLPRPQRRGALLQRLQELAWSGHPLRQARRHLPRRRRARIDHDLAALFIRHALVAKEPGLSELVDHRTDLVDQFGR